MTNQQLLIAGKWQNAKNLIAEGLWHYLKIPLQL
jgi:hypothetical protein